ncbi:hypothetical protein ACLOJK_004583, partial [Asimina triloba]
VHCRSTDFSALSSPNEPPWNPPLLMGFKACKSDGASSVGAGRLQKVATHLLLQTPPTAGGLHQRCSESDLAAWMMHRAFGDGVVLIKPSPASFISIASLLALSRSEIRRM